MHLIDQFERSTGIILKPYIEEFEVATPSTFNNFTGTYGGSIYGYQAPVWDSVMPRLQSLKQDAYIKGIQFTGGYAAKLHGYASSLSSGDTAGKLTFISLFTVEDTKEGGQ